MPRYVLALDQGTTSSRSILFDHRGAVKATAQREFPQLFPQPGHVEHDPEAIWSTQLRTARAVLRKVKAGRRDVAAIGITNQRETVVLWERASGRPMANAIVCGDVNLEPPRVPAGIDVIAVPFEAAERVPEGPRVVALSSEAAVTFRLREDGIEPPGVF